MSRGVRRITAIETQKNNPDRVNLYIDGVFALGLDKAVIIKNDLHQGDEVTEEVIEEILLEEEMTRAKAKALTYLGYRARSVEELRKKLLGKKFSEITVNRVIENLLRVGLLNDLQFALAFARSKMRRRPVGKRLLLQELIRHGIDNDLGKQVVEEVYEGRLEKDVALKLGRKKLDNVHGDEKTVRRKLSGFLMQRGFDWGVISTVIQELT